MKLLKKLLKWIAIGFASLIALVVLLAAFGPKSESKVETTATPVVEQVETVEVPTRTYCYSTGLTLVTKYNANKAILKGMDWTTQEAKNLFNANNAVLDAWGETGCFEAYNVALVEINKLAY